MSKAKDTLLTGNAADKACIYAALLLHDSGVEITAENIRTVIKTGKMKLEFSAFANVYANYFQRNSVESCLARKADAGGAADAAADAAPAAGGDDKKAAPKAAAKQEDEDTDFGMDLF